MKTRTEKKQLNTVEKKALKKDLLSFVMGGTAAGRCSEVGSKYADSIYVKRPGEELEG
ncbi:MULTISPECIES: hypothetical protein [Chryseobacterium]|uniref:hypothetical protein n=1 Tax=Chryseobacterium TaxID=59732 RepID=UPI0003E05EEA|nr:MULTISPECIES: hypothetical protein [Chryseobacterium]MBF6646476.1 hypothetical protein [Chryseobacterium indologenes]MBU3047419.1 hypothetical protein [Chryseobacterium indologenes]MEB4761973.1 hypothetical protein [Chryseobacterium indologenes]QIX80704.1 hypothetical protein FOB56_05405 [Chryseobacterium indologenes]QQQ69856.1 hypothetical protein JHW31_15250 [Chryseobacterium indologenes]